MNAINKKQLTDFACGTLNNVKSFDDKDFPVMFILRRLHYCSHIKTYVLKIHCNIIL